MGHMYHCHLQCTKRLSPAFSNTHPHSNKHPDSYSVSDRHTYSDRNRDTHSTNVRITVTLAHSNSGSWSDRYYIPNAYTNSGRIAICGIQNAGRVYPLGHCRRRTFSHASVVDPRKTNAERETLRAQIGKRKVRLQLRKI